MPPERRSTSSAATISSCGLAASSATCASRWRRASANSSGVGGLRIERHRGAAERIAGAGCRLCVVGRWILGWRNRGWRIGGGLFAAAMRIREPGDAGRDQADEREAGERPVIDGHVLPARELQIGGRAERRPDREFPRTANVTSHADETSNRKYDFCNLPPVTGRRLRRPARHRQFPGCRARTCACRPGPDASRRLDRRRIATRAIAARTARPRHRAKSIRRAW